MIVLIVMYYIISIFYEIISFKKRFITPSFLFVSTQIIMFTGILTYVDFSIREDKILIYIYILALIMFILGTEFAALLKKKDFNNIIFNSKYIPTLYQKNVILILIFLSLILCLYFFSRAEKNVFMQIINSVISGTENDYTEDRLAMYNISGIGYIYQFRVIILPILCVILLCFPKNTIYRKLAYVLIPIMIVFILGTGQRGGFVMFILMCVVYLLFLYKIEKNKKIFKTLIVIGSSAVLLFLLMTIYNGRVSDGGNAFQALLSRIFDSNQESAVIGFRYVYEHDIQWGKDWYYSFLDLLPGKNEYTQLSYLIFDEMYGSTRGTAPACIWGATYYNWGILGIFIFPLLLGIFYQSIYNVFTRVKLNKQKLMLFSSMFVVLGFWIADSPLFLFNQGFVTIVVLYFILNKLVRSN